MSPASPTNNNDAVVIDACILVSICSKEAATYIAAENALDHYAETGCEFFAPNVIVGEVIFASCHKLTAGLLTEAEHQKAIESYVNLMKHIATPDSDAEFVERAVGIRESYGCTRSSDGLYIALAEDLARTRLVEVLTSDRGMVNQAAKHTPTVTIKVL